MATLAHALQIIGGWIAPLVIFFIKRQSRFVSFHALQALLLQIIHVITVLIFVVGCVMVMAFTIFSQASQAATGSTPARPPFEIFLVFPFLWLFLIATNITIIVAAVMYCIKAGRGEWAEYPVVGRWARRILKIGPGGSNLA